MSRPTIRFRICSTLLMLALLSAPVCASLPPVRPIGASMKAGTPP
jgi:hypothetical protein